MDEILSEWHHPDWSKHIRIERGQTLAECLGPGPGYRVARRLRLSRSPCVHDPKGVSPLHQPYGLHAYNRGLTRLQLGRTDRLVCTARLVVNATSLKPVPNNSLIRFHPIHLQIHDCIPSCRKSRFPCPFSSPTSIRFHQSHLSHLQGNSTWKPSPASPPLSSSQMGSGRRPESSASPVFRRISDEECVVWWHWSNAALLTAPRRWTILRGMSS